MQSGEEMTSKQRRIMTMQRPCRNDIENVNVSSSKKRKPGRNDMGVTHIRMGNIQSSKEEKIAIILHVAEQRESREALENTAASGKL